jgi:hypothetical protein
MLSIVFDLGNVYCLFGFSAKNVYCHISPPLHTMLFTRKSFSSVGTSSVESWIHLLDEELFTQII